MNSILQTEKECLVTHYTLGLDKHHIFNGGLRDWSEKNGLWIWLRHDLHMALHGSQTWTPWMEACTGCKKRRDFEQRLKQTGQRAYEQIHSHEEFMRYVRHNYL